MVSGFECGLLCGPKGLERKQCHIQKTETLLFPLKGPGPVEHKVYIIHAQKLFSISNNMHGISITKVILLMLDIHTMLVYCKNHTRHINRLCHQISEF